MFTISTLNKVSKVRNEITGFLVFDIITGGLPMNRITHLFAPDGMGKTTLSLYLTSNMMYRKIKENELLNELLSQVGKKDVFNIYDVDEKYRFLLNYFDKVDIPVNKVKELIKEPYFLYIDCEQSFEPQWFSKLFKPFNIDFIETDTAMVIKDVDMNKEIGVIVQPFYYEDIDKILTTFEKYCIENKKKGYIVWDSVITPITKDVEKGKDTIGYRATAIQKLLDIHDKPLNEAGITSIFINQIREKIAMNMFAQNITGETVSIDANVPGGWALKFRSCLSICLLKGKDLSYGGTVDEKKNPFKIDAKVIKIQTGKNRLRNGGIKGTVVFVDEYGYSNILSMVQNLIDGIGNIPGDYVNHDKQVRFIQFMEKITNDKNVCETFIMNVLRKLLIKYQFMKGKELYDRYKWFYDEVIYNDAVNLNEFAKEYAGSNLIEEFKEDLTSNEKENTLESENNKNEED